MRKKSQKNKKSENHKLRNLSVQQQGNLTARTSYSSKNETSQPSKHNQTVPKFGEQILYFVLSKEESEHKIGDLAEHYLKLQPKLGIKGTRLWYYKEVAILLCQRFPRIIFITLYAWVEEVLRRNIK